MGNGMFKGCALGASNEPWEAIEAFPVSADEVSKTSINVYPERIHGNPPANIPASVDEACEAISKAAKGFGTDEKALIEALGSRSAAERYEIWTRYRQLNGGKNIEAMIKSECGSQDMGFALQLLAMPSDAAEARLIHEATRGCGVRERYLYPILCGRSNAEMALLKEAYFAEYEEDLALRLHRELGGSFRDFIMRCLQGSEQTYEPEWHTEERAERYAAALYGAGQGRWGTNETGVFKVVLQAPPPHLSNVNKVYLEKHGMPVLKALDSELGGDVEKACVYAAGMKIQPYRTVARQIRLACRGFGTDEMMLTALIIRYQHILKDVDQAHRAMYDGKSLAERVDDECAGLYQYLLLEVIKSAI